MSNIDCWPVACCCLIGLDGRGWHVDDPYAAWHLHLHLFLKLVPSPVARCCGNAITFRTHTLTCPGMNGTPRTDPSSAQWAGGQQSTPPVGPLRPLHPQHSGFSAPALWVPEFGPRLWTLGDGKRSPPQIVTLPPTKTCSSQLSSAGRCLPELNSYGSSHKCGAV